MNGIEEFAQSVLRSQQILECLGRSMDQYITQNCADSLTIRKFSMHYCIYCLGNPNILEKRYFVYLFLVFQN